MAAAPTPYNWTGCYIGGNTGLVKQDTGISDPEQESNLGSSTAWSNNIGWAAGGQVGCDYQINSNWVVGVRGMFDSANISQSISSVQSVEDFFSAENFGIKTTWFATVLARHGYLVVPDGLVYVKGGAAWKHVSYTDNGAQSVVEECEGPDFLCIAFSGGASATILGWDFGAGFEYAFMPNLSALVETRLYGLPTTLTYTSTAYPSATPFSTYSFNYTHDIFTVLIGMNLRFHQ